MPGETLEVLQRTAADPGLGSLLAQWNRRPYTSRNTAVKKMDLRGQTACRHTPAAVFGSIFVGQGWPVARAGLEVAGVAGLSPGCHFEAGIAGAPYPRRRRAWPPARLDGLLLYRLDVDILAPGTPIGVPFVQGMW